MYKFKPILKSMLWGGDKIIPYKEVESDKKQVGESWEISGVKDNESVVAEGVDASLTADESVFMTHSVHAFTIKSRLVGHHHARQNRPLVEVLTELLRAFMDAEIISYSMACSMAEITLRTPQRHTGECIEVTSCRAAREDTA